MNYRASDVDGSWAVNLLHESIKEFNAQTSRQTEQMLRLTKVIVILTAVMLFGLAVQIYLALYPPYQPSSTSLNPQAVAPPPAPPASSGR
jgi:hypothetical protein